MIFKLLAFTEHGQWLLFEYTDFQILVTLKNIVLIFNYKKNLNLYFSISDRNDTRSLFYFWIKANILPKMISSNKFISLLYFNYSRVSESFKFLRKKSSVFYCGKFLHIFIPNMNITFRKIFSTEDSFSYTKWD